MMLARALIALSASIVLTLGALHLVFTFRGARFDPRDAALKARMEEVPLVLTRETTIWRAWVGFNASHSLGAIFFGTIYGYLALAQPAVLFGSTLLMGVGAGVLASYYWLASTYWFRVPRLGIAAALASFLAGFLASRIGA